MKQKFTLLALAFAASGLLQAQKPDKYRETAIQQFKADIGYLASDELEGRLTGWPGEEKSAQYISRRFADLKLQPLLDNNTSWLQRFDIVKLRLAGGRTAFDATLDDQVHSFPLNKEFYPLSASANQASVEAGIVYLQFGIIADSLGRNDYKGKDVNGKLAVIMLGSPEERNPHSAFKAHEDLDLKLRHAAKAGAAAVVFIPSPDTKEKPSGELKRDAATQSIPVLYTFGWTDYLMNAQKARIVVDITALTAPGHNVIGWLPGKKAKYTVVVGAHHDHLGFGELGGSRATGANEIHNGADDNASGVAAMLDLAQRIRSNKKMRKYNYLFTAYSGEELGLLGSKFFVQHSPLAVENIAFMINIDMLGRLDPQKKTLMVNGTGTSPQWKTALAKVPTDTTVLKIATTESGLGPSDHASFYLRDIPVLHFFTGQHEDYHKPSDDADKINYEGLYESNSYIYRLLQVSGKGDKPSFTKTKDVSPGRSPFRVTLGVMPDYAFPGPGLRLDGVSEGKPAAAAGLQRGDIILQLGDTPILNVNDYMAALQKLNKGQTVSLVYKRQGVEGNQTVQVSL